MSNTEHLTWRERLSRFLSREPHNQKQLIEILRDAEQRNLMDRDALQMIEGVLAVSKKNVGDVMVPRPQMVVIESDAQPTAIFPAIIQSQHSRFPVIDDAPDKVIGILLAKDLLPFATDPNKKECTIRELIRPAVFIPESKRLDILLKEFRLNRNHMAIVVDEYGSVSGLITIEDVLEEIVGDIEDEYDIDEKALRIKEIEKNIFWVNALTPIDDVNTYFSANFSNADFDTIGGWVVHQLGHLPKNNETIQSHGFQITVIKATRRGIQTLQFKKISAGV